jgi:geranylgeranyl diphosphate synthase type II
LELIDGKTGELLEEFESFLRAASPRPAKANPVWEKLWAATDYSLFTGGKRFRPLLSLYTAQAAEVDAVKVMPWAAAVEMTHTYSLIHDDLPCLDNDDLRRGQPTNHKKFGEALALLAGDALLTEAFSLLSRSYKEDAENALALVGLLAEAAGSRGMIGGQVMDIAEDAAFKNEQIELIHQLKTGALIRVAVEGVALVGRLGGLKRKGLRRFGELLGLAFQLADDLLDYDPRKPESTSYVSAKGLEKTKDLLHLTSEQALSCLSEMGLKSTSLSRLIEFNLQRKS